MTLTWVQLRSRGRLKKIQNLQSVQPLKSQEIYESKKCQNQQIVGLSSRTIQCLMKPLHLLNTQANKLQNQIHMLSVTMTNVGTS